MKSTKQLEEEDLYHPDISSGLYRTNISELNSVESLKKFKGMLKSTFNSYNNVQCSILFKYFVIFLRIKDKISKENLLIIYYSLVYLLKLDILRERVGTC